jgi:hypothetical protein
MRHKHFVVCGLPRSGSTLLYEMMRRSVLNIEFLEREQPAVQSISRPGTRITKRPKDIFDLDAIVQKNGEHKDLITVVTIRDPRSVVSSVHLSYPSQPFIGFDHSLFVQPKAVSYTDPGLLAYASAIAAARGRTDMRMALVRYEDLVSRPEACRRQLAEAIGLDLREPFDGLDGATVSERFANSLKGARALDNARIDAWKRAAARVVRQFRLAPALFNALEQWGYESDRAWFARLAEQSPAALDDRPGLVVGYHTEDPLYRREAARLSASLRRLNLPVVLTSTPPGDWLSVVRRKAEFLREERRRHRGRLLYVDVDAVLHSDPWPYLNGIEADVAFAVLRDGKARSGTVFIADTTGAAAFLDDWCKRLAERPEAWDQAVLNDVVRDQRESRPVGYTVELLPPSLCYIFDRAAQTGASGSQPVVEHLQASREQKATDGELFQRRRQRIREIEAELGLPEV